jgi:hypothetical protein
LILEFLKPDKPLQRLEFLGDAVLDFLITSYLYSAYPSLKPGQLTDLRALSVNNKAFACVAVERCFDQYLLCDSKELSKAVKRYVDYIRRSVSDSGNDGGPKSPKVDILTFLLNCSSKLHLLLFIIFQMCLPTCSHINIVSNMWSFYLSFIIVTYALMRGDARAREHIF